jgi:hypothetical protein
MTTIDLPDLSDLMSGEEESLSTPPLEIVSMREVAQAAEALTPPKRHRRTKAQIEADEAAEKARKEGTAEGMAQVSTPEHLEAAAHALGYENAAQRDAILDGAKEIVNGIEQEVLPDFGPLTTATEWTAKQLEVQAHLDAPPDASDYQVLVDEIHYLREDIRDLTIEIGKWRLHAEQAQEKAAKVPVPEAAGVTSGPKGLSKS